MFSFREPAGNIGQPTIKVRQPTCTVRWSRAVGGTFGGLEPLRRYKPQEHWVISMSRSLRKPLQGVTKGVTG